MEMLDSLYITALILAGRAWERAKAFWASQDGVSNVVATIILLLIVVLLIGVFWDRLQGWMNDMMGQIFDTKYSADKLGKG